MTHGVAALLCAAVVAGCTGTVDGASRRQESLPLTQVLPTESQVTKAVGNSVGPGNPAVTGPITMLPNGIRDSTDATPVDCLGPATPLMRTVYEHGDVRDVALRSFSRYGEGLNVSSVNTGVVRFASDAAAARMFAVFATQWRSCNNTTVEVHVTPTSALGWQVTDVHQVNGILSATVLSGATGDLPSFPTEHAVGLAADCIVDVDVAVTAALPGRQVGGGRRAVGVVQAMLDNINRSR